MQGKERLGVRLDRVRAFAQLKGISPLDVFEAAYQEETGFKCRNGQVVDDYAEYSRTGIVPYYVRAMFAEM